MEWFHSTLTKDKCHSKARSQHIPKLLYGANVSVQGGRISPPPPLPGSFAADKFVFLKVSINSAWGPFLESNGRNTPPMKPYLQGHTYFSLTSVKNTTERLADHIDHKRIWRRLVNQDSKLQVKNLLRSRVAQEKSKRQKVTASVQTHLLNPSPACRTKGSPPHVLDCLATSEPAIYYHNVKSQMLVTFTRHIKQNLQRWPKTSTFYIFYSSEHTQWSEFEAWWTIYPSMFFQLLTWTKRLYIFATMPSYIFARLWHITRVQIWQIY